MSSREIDGFEVWAGALQSGDEPAVAQVETKPLDGKGKTRIFNVITQKSFARAKDAKLAADEVVNRVQSVSKDGVPHPLTY